MKAIKIKFLSAAIILFLLPSSCPPKCYCDTTKEFIDKYNISTKVSNDYQLRKELDEINRLKSSLSEEQKKLLEEKNNLLESAKIHEQNINLAEENKRRVDEYNTSLALRRDSLLEKKAKLNEDALFYYSQADVAMNKISNGILYGSIEKLKAYDIKYKSNIKIGMKYQTLSSKLIFDKTFKEYSYDMDEIDKEYEEQQRIYDEAQKLYDKGMKELETKQSSLSPQISIVPIEVDNFNLGSINDFSKCTDGTFQATTKLGEYRFTDATRVNSLFNGVVEKVGVSRTFGNYVIIRSGSNVKVSYFNLDSKSKLKVGDKVKQYDKIADVIFGDVTRIELYVNGAKQSAINKILLERD